MSIEIHFPGRCTFEKVYKGKLFYHGTGVYVKSSDATAVVVYKAAGLMNAGDEETFTHDCIIQIVKDATFKIGDY